MRWGHRLPRKDVKQLMSEIEVTAPRGFVARDQDGIQFRKTAGRTRDAALRFDDQDQDAEFPLHDLAQAVCRDIAKGELGREPLTGLYGILECWTSA